jgi:DNA polymerase elongation subunit (family B)
MDKVLHLILCEGKVNEAWQYTNEVIMSVKSLIDIRIHPELAEKLVLSRKIGNIEGYTNIQPHVTCYQKMKKRGEVLPGLGDRIRYMALPGASKDGISLMVDTPEHIKETDGRIDTTFYIEHQLLPPLERVFSAIGIDIQTGKKKLVEASLFGFESLPPKDLNTIKKKTIICKKPKTGLFSFN